MNMGQLRRLVVRLVVAAAFALADMMGVTPAVANDAPTQWTVKNASGRIVEHVSRAPDGRLIRSDPLTGQRLGTIEQGIGDRLILKDASGRRTGTITPGMGTRQIVTDPSGRRVGIIERGVGRQTIKNDIGRRTGTIEP